MADPEKQHFAMHADLVGDEREEIVIWNELEIKIFANAAPPAVTPGKRRPQGACNWTHYSGMS